MINVLAIVIFELVATSLRQVEVFEPVVAIDNLGITATTSIAAVDNFGRCVTVLVEKIDTFSLFKFPRRHSLIRHSPKIRDFNSLLFVN